MFPTWWDYFCAFEFSLSVAIKMSSAQHNKEKPRNQNWKKKICREAVGVMCCIFHLICRSGTIHARELFTVFDSLSLSLDSLESKHKGNSFFYYYYLWEPAGTATCTFAHCADVLCKIRSFLPECTHNTIKPHTRIIAFGRREKTKKLPPLDQ